MTHGDRIRTTDTGVLGDTKFAWGSSSTTQNLGSGETGRVGDATQYTIDDRYLATHHKRSMQQGQNYSTG